jgi:hypothetical protein
MIKVILMSTFCASTDDQELGVNLMRKMSSNSQGLDQETREKQKLKEEELSKYQSKQKEIESEYEPMIHQLQDVEFKPSMLL